MKKPTILPLDTKIFALLPAEPKPGDNTHPQVCKSDGAVWITLGDIHISILSEVAAALAARNKVESNL